MQKYLGSNHLLLAPFTWRYRPRFPKPSPPRRSPMPLKTRIFHEISAVCNRRSNLSEIPISNQSQNSTRDDEANANRRTQTADRPSTKPVPRSVFSRLAFALCALAHIASCDIVVPPDPPLPARDVATDDFVWGEIEIHREYEFIDVARVDCSLVLSTLTGHGICAPAKHPIGDVVSCPLAPPGANMIVSCLSADDVPAMPKYRGLAMPANSIFRAFLALAATKWQGPPQAALRATIPIKAIKSAFSTKSRPILDCAVKTIRSAQAGYTSIFRRRLSSPIRAIRRIHTPSFRVPMRSFSTPDSSIPKNAKRLSTIY